MDYKIDKVGNNLALVDEDGEVVGTQTGLLISSDPDRPYLEVSVNLIVEIDDIEETALEEIALEFKSY